MKATVNTPTAHSGGGLLLEAVVAAAAIAFGVGYLAASASTSQENCEEISTTERLLSGGNRSRVLAALAQFDKAQFTERALIEA